MSVLRRIIVNRNSILVFAVIMGLAFGGFAEHVKSFNVYILAITMTFSMTGLNLKVLNKFSKVATPFIVGIFLNYIVFGAVVMLIAWLLMPTEQLFYGFVVIAAAPPGVAIIPFSYILRGKVEYAIVGVTGAFVGSILFAPLYVRLFANHSGINPLDLFFTMISLVLIPMVISQILRVKPILGVVEKVRGRIVDWGFALLIFVAVGVNRQVFFSDPTILLLVSVALFLSTFGLGFVFDYLSIKIGTESAIRVPQNMLVTIKSSGFSVFTALTLFGKEAAIPSAVLAVMVLLYLIFLSIKSQHANR
ncbi:MAG: hypothetical protein JW783_09070 [Bacteroidales bacterium]|nr:hypothetical protein [Bacteroidales bacterium]MBN2748098.1 hypothetical protein [Bacteroidales bacterium]